MGRFLSLALVCLMSAACYTYTPLASAPAPGMEVKFELNDQGRAALADSIGPGSRSVLGRVRTATASGYDVAMGSVENIDGLVQHWSGELMHIRTEYVARSQERRLDSKRSWMAGLGAAAALVAAILSADLLGGAAPPETGTDPPPAGNQ